MQKLNVINDTLHLLGYYNSLIKYQIKCLSGEGKAELPFDNISPDFEAFETEVLAILESDTYPSGFFDSVNRIYLLSEANSDLSVEYPRIRKFLTALNPAILNSSLDFFRFISEEVSQYVKFDHSRDIIQKYPEYRFRENPSLLFPSYRLLSSAATDYAAQQQTDFENQLAFKQEKDREDYIQQQKEKLAEEIMALSMDFCNRKLPFRFIGNHTIYNDASYLFGVLLSDVLEKATLEDYVTYITFDYSLYPAYYRWEFHRKSVADYPGLKKLFGFERLLKIIGSTLLLKKLSTEPTGQIHSTSEENTEDIPGTCNLPEPEKENEEDRDKSDEDNEPKEPKENVECEDPGSIIETDTYKPKPAFSPVPEYILPVPLLHTVYEAFNGELWEDISLVCFLDMFTTQVNRLDNFQLKQKQTTRFYYLLKKIWINGDQSLFASEKDWIESFLDNYDLSFSAYTNQSVKNNRADKHIKFIRAVDKILPKNDNF